MFLQKVINLTVVLIATTACATQPPAPVMTVTPKPVATTCAVPHLDVYRVPGPLTPAQVAEIKSGYMKAFPSSKVLTEQAGSGAVNFLVISK